MRACTLAGREKELPVICIGTMCKPKSKAKICLKKNKEDCLHELKLCNFNADILLV